MRAPINWIRDFVPITLPIKELAEKLTMAGLEVERIETSGHQWQNVVVGEVVDIQPHPNADKLKLATVNLSEGCLTVVCGAPNLQLGAKVPLAKVGARLIDPHTGQTFQLEPAKIRGIVSEGMLCSEKELGLSEDYSGVMLLPAEAPAGLLLSDYLGEMVFDLEITPNRPDCLSIIGIAREIAALTRKRISLPQIDYPEESDDINVKVKVVIADADLCPRYTASLIEGIKIAPSPPWMQQRLLAAGMRPINNIVDITNYVMLEYGQPLHAFDYEKINDHQIIVRRAGEGEMITTLDGMERNLSSETLVIADSLSPVAIAGVMGGSASEVTTETNSILLESANFNPRSIRRTSKLVGLRSEASLRFEKGISPELPILALRRATQLMLELAGGKAAKGLIDVYPGKVARNPIRLTTSQVKKLLGVEISLNEIIEVLDSLGFDYQQVSGTEILATSPYWRGDVSLTADLIEEVARIIGYDKIPTTLFSTSVPYQEPAPALSLREKLQDILVGFGFQEVISYSLVSREKIASFSRHSERSEESQTGVGCPTSGNLPAQDKLREAISAVRVANPMTREQEYLRISLLPNLLSILAQNQKHYPEGIRIFEIGKVFLPREKDLPEEREMLIGLLTGSAEPISWIGEKGWLDFFSAKGIVEGLLAKLGIEADFEAGEEPGFHPGRTAKITVMGNQVGVVAELHPKLREEFDLLPQPVALFELDLTALLPLIQLGKEFHPLPRFPGSVRDLALVVDKNVPAKSLMSIIQSSPLVSQVKLFDLYTGEAISAGKKSLAFRIAYQSPTHTLTDEEVNQAEAEILHHLSEETSAELRH